jgi:hypothetical protein
MRKTTQLAILIMFSLLLSFCKEKVTDRTVILNGTKNQIEIKYRIVDTSEKDNFLRKQNNILTENLTGGVFSYQELIPNSETAVKIAFIYLSQVYGEKKIIDEFPLNVDSTGGNWIITGTLHSGLGGTAYIALKKNTGTVINLFHGK